ncbi:ketopantoate reductase PanE/ApbA C terminal-domain-containing protein [Entophlyctis helioformis]|nr:ketopantoate reductase PanE/ApbA C terminal-domain-containing protein [Entophlyctis helioformis]
MPCCARCLGAGAVGAFYGARLHSATCKVSVVCRSNYKAVAAHGFKLQSPTFGSWTWTPYRVFASNEEAAQSGIAFSLIVVATKALPDIRDDSADLAPIVASVDASSGGRTPRAAAPAIVLIQNGFGVEWPYRSRFPSLPILSAVTVVSCQQTEPGTIIHNRWTRISTGVYLGSAPSAAAPASASPSPTVSDTDLALASQTALDLFTSRLHAGGIKDAESMSPTELQLVRWHKLAINASFNPSSILAGGIGNADMVADPLLETHIRGCMSEILSAGPRIFGVPFPSHLASMDTIIASTKRNTGAKPSMLVDWEAGRPLELEVIVGNPLRLAKEHGVEMPRLQTVYALLKSAAAARQRASSTASSQHRPAKL